MKLYKILIGFIIGLCLLNFGLSKSEAYVSNYSYDINDKLILASAPNQSNHFIQYDNNGNTTSRSKVPRVSTIPSINLSHVSYEIYAYGVPHTATSVQFPTWTENNGQDDLEHPWIVGEKVMNGIWKIVIPFNKHNYETGIYLTHVYVDGIFFGGVATQVNPSPTSVSTLPAIDLSSPSYEVYAYGVPHTATSVQFPTWTAYNWQDDLEHPWIVGEKVTNGIWKIVIPFNKHNYETGIYYTDVFVDGNYFSGITTQVNPSPVTISSPNAVSLGNGSYDIYIDGVSNQVNHLVFPTWTEANGQDDLIIPYIKGERISNQKWKVTIEFSAHNYETGNYITHIYSVDNVGNTIILAVVNTKVT